MFILAFREKEARLIPVQFYWRVFDVMRQFSYAELSFVLLLWVGLWSRFLTYVEITNFELKCSWYKTHIYMPVKKTQYRIQIMEKSK